MKAWRLHGLGGELVLRDIPEPGTRAGAVSVRVRAVPLLSYLRSYVAGKLPGYRAPEGEFTPGTYAVGEVEGLGPQVYGLHVGQRVFISPYLAAAENVPEPAEALLALTAADESAELLDAWPDGTLAEMVSAPVPTVTPVPAALDGTDDLRLAALARCVVPYGGLLRARLTPGETVIVHGATGAFGFAGVLVALAMGAARVSAVRLSGDRDLDAKALREAGDGGASCALDMVGRADSPAGTLASLGALRRGGRLVLMGGVTVPLPVDYRQVMMSGLEVVGNFMYPRTAPAGLMALAASGLLDLSPIPVTSSSLGQLPDALRQAEGRGAPLVVVTP